MIRSPAVRVAILWLALLAAFHGKSVLATALFGADYAVDRHIVMALLTTALVVPMIVLARRYLDQESFPGLGLAVDAAALHPFAIGILAWLLPFALGVTLCLVIGLVTITPVVPWSEILAFLPLLVLLVFLLEALPEELAFRGYIQTNLAKTMPLWAAVAVQAILFGSWGVALWFLTAGGIDPLHASLFYVMGAVLGMLRAITGSVWTGIGFHLAFQTVSQLLQNAERGHFVIENAMLLQVLALGALPFSVAVPFVELFYRGKVAWRARAA